KLKYVANLLVTIHNLSTAEALVFAEKAGIDPVTVLDVLGDSAAASRMLQVRGPMMVAHRYEPATMKLEVYQKDIEIIDAFAKSQACPTPLFSASIPYYTRALAEGRGKEDTAAIVTVLREAAGLKVE
ncbi:MAG: NAD(P)-dependent oxidoreductase, partial [Candidatus Eremiobacteraeota bacterium]|nr:NAD(P)-dependent oxidoreductase [Candidatus Eremiobacteraeota bacterium]